VKPEKEYTANNSESRYLSSLGYGTEFVLKEGSYDKDTVQQVLTIKDYIKISDYLRFQFTSIPDLLVTDLLNPSSLFPESIVLI